MVVIEQNVQNVEEIVNQPHQDVGETVTSENAMSMFALQRHEIMHAHSQSSAVIVQRR